MWSRAKFFFNKKDSARSSTATWRDARSIPSRFITYRYIYLYADLEKPFKTRLFGQLNTDGWLRQKIWWDWISICLRQQPRVIIPKYGSWNSLECRAQRIGTNIPWQGSNPLMTPIDASRFYSIPFINRSLHHFPHKKKKKIADTHKLSFKIKVENTFICFITYSDRNISFWILHIHIFWSLKLIFYPICVVFT